MAFSALDSDSATRCYELEPLTSKARVSLSWFQVIGESPSNNRKTCLH